MQVIIFSSNLVPCHILQLGSKKSMDALLGGTQVQRFWLTSKKNLPYQQMGNISSSFDAIPWQIKLP
jgi:hypothetical protein